jgi:hypothetical protein
MLKKLTVVKKIIGCGRLLSKLYRVFSGKDKDKSKGCFLRNVGFFDRFGHMGLHR